MLFILPIGHESRVERYPYATFGIMIVCLLVFIPTSIMDAKYIEQIQEVAEQIYEINPAYFESEHRKNMEEATGYSMELDAARAEELRDLERQLENLQQKMSAYRFGCVPIKWNPLTSITSMFLHGGWLHLLGNMLFLYMVGCNIEDKWGPWFFLLFYSVGGMAASGLHSIFYPDNVPLIGASGAIAAAMGAFMVRYAKTKIQFFYIFLLFLAFKKGKFSAPAYIMMPLWFANELLMNDLPDGVAHYAHIGGFAFGAIGGLVLFYTGLEKKYFEPKYGLVKEEHEVPEEYQLAQIMLGQGKKQEAIVALKDTVRNHDNYIPALSTLGKIYADENNRAEYLKTAEALAKQAMATKKAQILIDLFKRTTEKYPDMSLSAPVQFRLATELAAMSLFEDAVYAYRNLAHAYPGEMLALKSLLAAGDVLADKMGMPHNAAEMYRYISTYYPESPIAEQARQKLAKIQNIISDVPSPG